MPSTRVPTGISLVDVDPGIFLPLLVAEGNALGLAVELEHDDVDLVTDVEVLRGVVDPAPGDVGDVQQAVDAAEIDEHTVVGDVLDHALERSPSWRRSRVSPFLRSYSFSSTALRDRTMLLRRRSRLMTLNSRSRPFRLSRFLTGLMSASEPGRNARTPDVDRQAALDAVDDPALDDAALLEAVLHVGPDAHARRLGVGQQDVAFEVLGLLEEHFDVVADRDGQLALFVEEFRDRDQTFRLVADVDHHGVVGDRHDPALDDLALGEIAHALVVHVR